MVAVATAAPNTAENQIPIETMRALAILLLVSYHVIGTDATVGLKAGYPELLRLFADFFIDLRMPFFAFIAGFLYAIRAPTLARYRSFLRGKLLFLFLPCAIAAMAFALVAILIGNRFALPLDQLWRAPFSSYAHFWFLQSIIVIFATIGLLDALLRQRFTSLIFLASIFVYLSPFVFETNVMSLNGALYLLPYFLMGLLVSRFGAQMGEEVGRISLLLLVIAVACALWNVKVLYETGSFSVVRRDIQSLGFGLSICLLVFFSAPRMPLLEKLSPYGFTIYLYHIFGTVAAREICDLFGGVGIELRFVLGLSFGLALPILLHEAICRMPRAQQVLLGRRPQTPMCPTALRV